LLILDFEANGHYPGGTMRVDQAVRFVERVRERTGTYCGLYASENRIGRMLNDSSVSSQSKSLLRRCWLWVANYHYEPVKLAPWNNWTLWQYTGDGKCDLPRSTYPISVANVRCAERNIFRGSAGAACSFWQQKAWNPSR
jgi:lysozyme